MSGLSSVIAIATMTGFLFHSPMVLSADALAQEDDAVAQVGLDAANTLPAPTPDVEAILSSEEYQDMAWAASLSPAEAADEPVTREEFSANLAALVMGMKQRMANQVDRTP